METNLVLVQKNEIYTTSKILADELWIAHDNLLRTFNSLFEKNKDLEKNTPLVGGVKFQWKISWAIFFEHEFINKQKRKYKWYLMNEQAFILMIMQLWRYEKAIFVQNNIVKAFFEMKRVLLNHENASWIETRGQTKQIRKQETDILKELLEYIKQQNPNSNYVKNSNTLYSNYTKMTNKALEFLLWTKWSPIKDLVPIQELWFISIVEDRAWKCILDWMSRKLPYKEIYEFAKVEINKLVDMLNFKPRQGLAGKARGAVDISQSCETRSQAL